MHPWRSHPAALSDFKSTLSLDLKYLIAVLFVSGVACQILHRIHQAPEYFLEKVPVRCEKMCCAMNCRGYIRANISLADIQAFNPGDYKVYQCSSIYVQYKPQISIIYIRASPFPPSPSDVHATIPPPHHSPTRIENLR